METTAEPAKTRRRLGRPPRIGRADVIAAATELFARRGYRSTTLAAIAASLKVTDASILHYFENKAAILDAVLEADAETGQDLALRLIKPGGLASLRGLQEWAIYMEAHPLTTNLQVVLSAEALNEHSELHGRFDERYRFLRRRLTRALQKGIDAGELRPDVDAAYEATSILAYLDGMRLQWFYAPDTVSLAQHVHTYVEHVIARVAVRS